MRGKRAKVDVESGEIDNQFWAQTAHQPVDGPNDDEDNPTFDDGPGEYNDDFDDPEAFEGPITVMGGDSMSVDAGEQDLLAATAGQERKVKPEFVNYAKKAKRVDVRRLKQNIWNGLDIVIVDDDDDDDHGARMVRDFLVHARPFVAHDIGFNRTSMVITGRVLLSSVASPRNLPLTRAKRDNSARSSQVSRNRTLAINSKRSARVSVSSVFCIWRTSRDSSWRTRILTRTPT